MLLMYPLVMKWDWKNGCQSTEMLPMYRSPNFRTAYEIGKTQVQHLPFSQHYELYNFKTTEELGISPGNFMTGQPLIT